jgi:hypothetical protein
MKYLHSGQFTYPMIVMLVGGLCSLMLEEISLAQSQQTWLRCGNIDGSTNAVCPLCVGTCKMARFNGARQTYSICQDTGTGCTMPANTNAFCSGTLYDGGTTGGCAGNITGTCQYNIKKCPP